MSISVYHLILFSYILLKCYIALSIKYGHFKPKIIKPFNSLIDNLTITLGQLWNVHREYNYCQWNKKCFMLSRFFLEYYIALDIVYF